MDGDDPSSVAMYMTFKIDKTTDEWTKYCSDKKIRRLDFRTAQDMMPTEMIVQPKPLAPMIVQCKFWIYHYWKGTNTVSSESGIHSFKSKTYICGEY